MKRVFRFIKALWRYIWYGEKVTFDQFTYRMEICKNCPDVKKDNWTCGICGCYLDKKLKMSTEKCPKGKW
jgi:hypothetical protein